jgi:hypothetical protein
VRWDAARSAARSTPTTARLRSSANQYRWTIRADEQEVPVVGPPIDNDDNAIQFGLAVSRDQPDAQVRVTRWHRAADTWDTGEDIAQFKAGEPLPEQDWV